MEKNIDGVLELLKGKGNLKQDVYNTTLKTFEIFQASLASYAKQMKKLCKEDKFKVKYEENGRFESELKFGGDLLIFNMHTNVFGFPANHAIHQSKYVKENTNRQYCGMIEVYNFLADSFKYSRMNDVGYMIARIFVNGEGHFFIEGEDQLGFLYKDFPNLVMNKEMTELVIEAAITYAINFDLWVPPYQSVKQLNVAQKIQHTGKLTHLTGKRVGFQFEGLSEFKGES